jgi:hypothetical protein
VPGSLVGESSSTQEVPVPSTYSVASVALGRRFVEFGQRQALRWQVLVTRWALDQELAEGIDSDSTPARALRSTQLLRPRHRRVLARGIERLIKNADRDPRLSSAVPLARDQIAEARETLLCIAQVLSGSPRVHPRGVAMVRRLLCDGTSPVYLRTVRGALELQARVALECLVGQPWTSPHELVAEGVQPLVGDADGDR